MWKFRGKNILLGGVVSSTPDPTNTLEDHGFSVGVYSLSQEFPLLGGEISSLTTLWYAALNISTFNTLNIKLKI
jgi:hypothetical protein